MLGISAQGWCFGASWSDFIWVHSLGSPNHTYVYAMHKVIVHVRVVILDLTHLMDTLLNLFSLFHPFLLVILVIKVKLSTF